MNICKIVKYEFGYGWYGINSLESTCILAISLNKKVNLGSLLNYRKFGRISIKDFRAIRRFDKSMGGEQDLKQIKNLAKHLKNIKLEFLKVDETGEILDDTNTKTKTASL